MIAGEGGSALESEEILDQGTSPADSAVVLRVLVGRELVDLYHHREKPLVAGVANYNLCHSLATYLNHNPKGLVMLQ